MENILGEIRRAFDAGFYYPALVLSLTLPDICAALESENGESSGPKYRTWCDNNLPMVKQVPGMEMFSLTSSELYKLRCGVIHQGRASHNQMRHSRIIFSVPDPKGNYASRNIVDGMLNLDLEHFCESISAAVREWLAKSKGNPTVAAHLEQVVQPRFMNMSGVSIPVIT